MVTMIKGQLRNAVEALVSAVRKVINLSEKPSPSVEERTHVKEFLPEMERMLVDQLVTSVEDDNVRREILKKYELEYLDDALSYTEAQRITIELELDSSVILPTDD